MVVGSEALSKVLGRLRNVREESSGYRASCPVPGHGNGRGDQDPSLTVKQGDEQVLINCFAGCESEEVVEVLGLSMADLFDKPPSQARNTSQGKKHDGKPSAVWEIRDRHGEVQAEHVRFDKLGEAKECLWKLPGADEYGESGHLARQPVVTERKEST